MWKGREEREEREREKMEYFASTSTDGSAVAECTFALAITLAKTFLAIPLAAVQETGAAATTRALGCLAKMT